MEEEIDIKELKKATQNKVSDEELMKFILKATTLNIPLEKLPELVEFSFNSWRVNSLKNT